MQILSLVQLKYSDISLAPLLSDEPREGNFLRSFSEVSGLENNFDAVLAEMESEISMGDILKELGCMCTIDKAPRKEMLSRFLPLNEITVARILGKISCTDAGLSESKHASLRFYSAFGIDTLSDLPSLNSWNTNAPGINWVTVMENLDHEGFYVPNEAEFSFIMSCYKINKIHQQVERLHFHLLLFVALFGRMLRVSDRFLSMPSLKHLNYSPLHILEGIWLHQMQITI